jgi:hypothetical protein
MTVLEPARINVLTKYNLLIDDDRKAIELCPEMRTGALAEMIQQEVTIMMLHSKSHGHHEYNSVSSIGLKAGMNLHVT